MMLAGLEVGRSYAAAWLTQGDEDLFATNLSADPDVVLTRLLVIGIEARSRPIGSSHLRVLPYRKCFP
jgi:hypothetical protein